MEYELSGSYPIYRDNSVVGTLTVETEGLYTHFKAQCEPYDGLLRLYILDREMVGCLGLMEPSDGKLRLRRQLTRNSLRGFPCSIMRAELNDGASQITPISPPVEIIPVDSDDLSPQLEETAGIYEESVPQEQNIPPPAMTYDALNSGFEVLKNCEDTNSQATGIALLPTELPPNTPVELPQNTPADLPDASSLPWLPCACPCSLFSGLEEKRLFGRVRGALQLKSGAATLIAVPEDQQYIFPRRSPVVFFEKLKIFDENFLICSVENGKSKN